MSKTPNETLRALTIALLMGQIPCDFAPIDSKTGARKDGLNHDLWSIVTNNIFEKHSTYPKSSGTTCGFLCHWLLWALGCRDPLTINRTDSTWNAMFPYMQSHWMKYLTAAGGGANIVRILYDYGYLQDQATTGAAPSAKYSPNSTTRKGAFKTVSGSGQPTPEMGDIAYIVRAAPSSDPKKPLYKEHVYVCLAEVYRDLLGAWRLKGHESAPAAANPSGDVYWLVGEGGQVGGSSMKFTIRTIRRTDYSDEVYKTSKRWVDLGDVSAPQPASRLDGWLRLTGLPQGRWVWRSPLADPNSYSASAYPLLDPFVMGDSRGVAAFTYAQDVDPSAQKLAYRLTVAVLGGLLDDWPYDAEDWDAEVLYYMLETYILDPIKEHLAVKPSTATPTLTTGSPSGRWSAAQRERVAAALRDRQARSGTRTAEAHDEPDLEATLRLGLVEADDPIAG